MKSKKQLYAEAGIIDPNPSDSDLEEYDLGPNQGGRKKPKKGLMWEVLRTLRAPEDIPLLHESLPARRANLTQIRHSHHQLARQLAKGLSQQEASEITGYSPAYISVIKTDPSFAELIAYYGANEEEKHVDVLERMRILGLNTVEELQMRLETDPDSYSLRELMEQAELMLVKPMAVTRSTMPIASAGSASHGVQVNVNFVKSESSHSSDSLMPSPNTITIDHEP